MSIPVLTLREALRYDRDTGLLFWRPRPIHHFSNDHKWSAKQAQARWNTQYAHTPAFRQPGKRGYLSGTIDGKTLTAHRVAWAIVMGYYSTETIDHANGDRHDNRWANLRLASRSQQSRNCSPNKSGTSRYLGVSFRKERQNWRAVIFVDGKQMYLGSFRDEEAAARAYDAAASQHFGEFARLNFSPV